MADKDVLSFEIISRKWQLETLGQHEERKLAEFDMFPNEGKRKKKTKQRITKLKKILQIDGRLTAAKR